MSWKVVQLVFEVAPAENLALLALVALAEWSQDDGVSWHPLEDLAKRTRCSVRRAQELVKGLATPNADGDTLLFIRRAKRTTFFEINLELLARLHREKNGQQSLWIKPQENLLESCGENVESGGKVDDPKPELAVENTHSRAESARSRVSTIRTVINRKEPEEPENHQPQRYVVEAEEVLWIVKKLARGTSFPASPAGLDDRQYDARQKLLDSQREYLRRKGT